MKKRKAKFDIMLFKRKIIVSINIMITNSIFCIDFVNYYKNK